MPSWAHLEAATTSGRVKSLLSIVLYWKSGGTSQSLCAASQLSRVDVYVRVCKRWSEKLGRKKSDQVAHKGRNEKRKSDTHRGRKEKTPQSASPTHLYWMMQWVGGILCSNSVIPANGPSRSHCYFNPRPSRSHCWPYLTYDSWYLLTSVNGTPAPFWKKRAPECFCPSETVENKREREKAQLEFPLRKIHSARNAQ